MHRRSFMALLTVPILCLSGLTFGCQSKEEASHTIPVSTDLNKEADKRIQAIQSDPNIPDAQKQRMIGSIRSSVPGAPAQSRQ